MKRDTIKKHADFLTPKKYPSVSNDIFILKTKPSKITGNGRFGVVATKKTFKLAVDRNRAKRLLRDWLGFYERFMLSDVDYVLIAKPEILKTERHPGRKEMRAALQRVAKIYSLKAETATDDENNKKTNCKPKKCGKK